MSGMCRSRILHLLMATLSCLFLAAAMRAYVPFRWGTGGVPAVWQESRFPLTFYLNETTAAGMPNIEPGTDVPGAVRAALQAWQSVPTSILRFNDLALKPDPSSLTDGINLITMADTAVNRELLGGSGGAVALTRMIFDATTGKITESDVILNPAYLFSSNLAPGTYDLQSIVTHELGHALGSDHSIAQNDTMFPAVAPGEFFQRYLSADAIAFASFAYPDPDRIAFLGSFSGRITSGGGGVFGAAVTAMNLDHPLIYAAISERDGSFRIDGPAPGRYILYAEPLDGPFSPDQFMAQGPHYQGLNTSFRTVFSGERTLGRGSPRNLQVDLTVPAGAPAMNIDRMGRGDPESGVGYLAAGTVTVSPGETLSLLIGGADTWKVPGTAGIEILGGGIAVDAGRGVKRLKNKGGADVGISVVIDVAADALPGPRTLVLQMGGQRVAASTGGILVAPRTLPASKLYFPYLKADPLRYTGIALVNSDPVTPAVLRVSGRNSQGAMLWDEDGMIPVDLTLPPGAQSARLEREIFNLPLNTEQAGCVTVESDVPGLQGFFLAGDFGEGYLDGAEAFTRSYAGLYFVDVLQDSRTFTEIHLMNTLDVAVNVDLRLSVSGAGSLTAKRTIPPRGKIGEKVSDLFGITGSLHSAHIMATAELDALVGFSLIRQPDAVFGLNAQPLADAGPVLYSPQLAVGELGAHFETRLNVVNVGSAATTVTAALFDELGFPLVDETRIMELAPQSNWSLDVGSAFGLKQGQGYIRVSASGDGKLLGSVLFGDGDPTLDPLAFGAALPLSASGDREFLFAHVAQGRGYYTGVAFLAPMGATLRVTAFDSGGNASGEAQFQLAAGHRLSMLLRDLIPGTDGQVGGYVRVRSADAAIIGFELFGTLDGRLLSAVPPQRVRQ